MSSQQPSILVIGATGLIGKHLLQAAFNHSVKPLVHAFVRSPSKLTESEQQQLTTIVQGDATNACDIRRALVQTCADTIVIGIGTPHLGEQHVREENAQAVAQAVGAGTEFEHVKIIIVSAAGASESSVIVGFGIGMMIEFILRNALADHNEQEKILRSLDRESEKRVLIVRPTYLSTGQATGKIKIFGAQEKAPTIKTDRQDVAEFVIDQVCGDGKLFGTAVSITSTN